MGRKIYFGEEGLTLTLTGVTSFFALKRKIHIPYNRIKSIVVDDFRAPRWMLRMPGTSISFLNIYEGSFKYANEWYFLSFEQNRSLLIMELEGHERYQYVVFQMEHPTEAAAEIKGRIHAFSQ
ncbi:hypothetical protein [Bacillus badius]|nr:hypothetical protein [Bacillus badius]KZR60112.1 hypothetical protein A3781_07890 [Bacillus badius]MED4717914.1 hypothetical protein [Bacillus badius]